MRTRSRQSPTAAPEVWPLPVELRVARFVRQCRLLAARLPHLEGDGRYDALMAALHQAPADCRTRDGRAVIAALVAELADRALHETARERGQPARPAMAASGALGDGHPGSHPLVDRAIDVMRIRASDPAICLDAVAGAVGVSRWHLSRLLRTWTGHSFFGLLAALRVQEAKRLLAETSLSIKEVAARCGYDHVSQFDRQFGRLSGVTPGVYRSLWQVRPGDRRDRASNPVGA